MRAGRTPVAGSEVSLVQKWCGDQGPQILERDSDQSPHGIGCKARQVRGTYAGVGSLPVATPRSRRLTASGVLPKTQTVNSSTMKGASSPCQSAAAETEPNRQSRVRAGRGQLLYSRPRNQRARGAGNDAGAGASDIPDRSGRKCPTDVTAVAKSQTNRARSMVAGVVSGAGSRVSRCLKCRTLMRVPPVGAGKACTRRLRPEIEPGCRSSKAVGRRVRAYGGARRDSTRKG
jgi:hypothetical protein